MKQRKVGLAFIFTFLLVLVLPLFCSAYENEPVLYLKFDETSGTTAADSSGNGNNGVLMNSPAWVTGKSGNALSFDGADDYVRIAYSASLDASQITVSAWVYKRSNALIYGQIVSREYGNSSDELWSLFYHNSANDEYLWSVRTNNGGRTLNGGSSIGDINQWVHLVGTYDGTDVKLYKNGIQIVSGPLNGNILPESTPILISAGDNGINGISEFTNAIIDDVRVYNYALTAQEVSDIYYNFTPDSSPPSMFGGSPNSTLAAGTTQTILSLTTGENASCKYSTVLGVEYSSMTNTFLTADGISHSATISGLQNGQTYNYYVRCQDNFGNANPGDYLISFSVASSIVDITSGIIGYWKFDEASGTTLIDSSEKGNNGVLMNGPVWTAGKFGNALSFDGINDYVITSTPATTQTDNWTMAAWVNPAGINQYGVIAHNGRENYNLGGSNNGYSLVISDGAGGTGNTLIGIANGLAFIGSGYNFSSANVWYHVVMLSDSGTTKFYVNGVQTATTTSRTYNVPTTGVTIGAFQPWNTKFFNGSIDEVRVYNRSLTAQEIQELYNFISPDIIPPVRSSGFPSGTLQTGTTSTTMSLTTDENATCKYSNTANTVYSSMTNTFTTTGTTSHLTTIKGLQNGITYNYYIKCQDTAGNANTNDFIISFSISSTFITDVTTGLIGYWKFDETTGIILTDSSGNGNNGVLMNGPVWTTGKSGNALSFDGVNDYVSLGTKTLGYTTLTVSAWLKYNKACSGNYGGLISKDGSSDFALTIACGLVNGYPVSFVQNEAGNASGSIYSSKNVLDGNWHHMVMTQDGTYNRLYLDGAFQNQFALAGNVDDDIIPITIGSYSTLNNYFNGSIDEIRIYNRALDSTEIQFLYNPNQGDKDPPIRFSGSPSVSVPSGTTQTTISLSTNENATCKYSTNPSTAFSSMPYTFSTSNGLTHTATVTGLQDGYTYYYYVRCQDSSLNVNTNDYYISFTVIASVKLTSGLIGHWKFDEGSGGTASDCSGNDNSGILMNGPSWVTGKYNGALSFDGINDYVSIGPKKLGYNRLTVSAFEMTKSTPSTALTKPTSFRRITPLVTG